MKKWFFLLLVLLLAGGYFFALENPNNPTVFKLKTLFGIGETTTGMVFTWLTDTGETLPTETTVQRTGDTKYCTMQYAPVCATVQIECIKAPCYPIQQTFGNTCMMDANPLAKFLYTGECKSEWSAGLANPASINCEDNGGTLDIREWEGGQYGVCIFPNGKECEERAFMRGECSAK